MMPTRYAQVASTETALADAEAAITALPVLASGVYLPVAANLVNLDSATPIWAQWLRVGDVVTVSGKVDVDATAASVSTSLTLTLPVASTFSASPECAGVASTNEESAIVGGVFTLDVAQLVWVAVTTTPRAMYFTFTYQII